MGPTTRIIVMLLAAAVIALSTIVPTRSASAIEVCYDYAIWRLTGDDPRPVDYPRRGVTGIPDLRAALEKKNYGKVVPTPKASELRADDVVIIPGHVGYVTAPNAIDHFIQVEGTTLYTDRNPLGIRYPARELPRYPRNAEGQPVKGGFFEGDSLQTFMTVRPFRPATTYEVWRQTARQSTADTRFVGSWVCQCKITILLKADRTGAWVDSRGGPAGSMSASGTFPGTWTPSGDGVLLTIPPEFGNRSGTVHFQLSDGKLRDRWGGVYAR